VHEVAEQLEHIKSSLLIEKLDQFLGYPQVDPHGDPIPNAQGKIKNLEKTALKNIEKGSESTIIAVKDSDSNLLKYLEKIGAKPGVKIKVEQKEDYDGSLQISIGKERFFVSKEVSENILVTL
jgi:DtxR family transcriptional regulator, Mn-dependent transcriptional regulator